jgi:murein DD-endopeptidase MepM/ murein hydrolase activator NlpD
VLLIAVATVVVALASSGPSTAETLHTARTELADARLEWRIADRVEPSRAIPMPVAAERTPATAEPPTWVGAAAAGTAYRVLVAEAAAQHVATEANDHHPVAGLIHQIHGLVRGASDEDTAGRLKPPLRGVITSGFGPRQLPAWDGESIHNGIDIFAPSGSPVAVAARGQVVVLATHEEAGLTVVIDHGYDHLGRRLHTVYSHLATTPVLPGQHVSTGETIGTVGSSGRHSTGPHLHFEVHVEGVPVDPRAWF